MKTCPDHTPATAAIRQPHDLQYAFRALTMLACAALTAVFAGIAAFTADGAPSGSTLPSGPGQAAAFPGDRDIGSHPEVIFADDFESEPPWNLWQEIRNPGNRVLSVDAPADAASRLGRRCLKVTAVLGENTGGGLTRWFQPAPRVFIRFYVKFAPDCDYLHHFVTLRANRGLTGRDRWSGFGGAGEKPLGHERFSTALEPWGNWGRYPPPGRWHFYSYWHQMKPSPDGRYWGNSFEPADQPHIPRNRWICAEFMLQENTPGQPDGQQAFWIDGRLFGHWRGINWRKDPILRANALTLESYVTDRWTRHRTNVVWFDNVVIARQYIGPTPPAQGHRP